MLKIRFQLRSFLLTTTIVAIIGGMYTQRSLKQRGAVNKLIEQNGVAYFYVDYDKKFVQQSVVTQDEFWLHFLYPIKMVILEPDDDCTADEQVATASQIGSLKYLFVWPGGRQKFDNQPEVMNAEGGITDMGLQSIIENLDSLKQFATTSAKCSEDKILELDGALKDIEVLAIYPHEDSGDQPFLRN